MKKLLVLALAVVLTLSLAVVASAATFSPYVGGEFQLTYSSDVNKDAPILSFEEDAYGARFKSYVTGTVEDKDTNTWAKIGCLIKTWGLKQTIDDAATEDTTFNKALPVFEGGIKKIGDVLDIWYTNDENGNPDRGQTPLAQRWFKFGGDPSFDRSPGDVFGFDINTENVVVNIAYNPNKVNDLNLLAASGTFKFDGGKVWVGLFNGNDPSETTQTGVGVEYKFGFGTLKVDYNIFGAKGADDTSYLQAAIDFEKLNVTLVYDDKYYFGVDGGIGFGVTYNVTDKLYIGGRSISPNDDADKTDADNQTNFYLGIKYGVFDTRIGSGTEADGDAVSYITTHVGMW